MKNELVEKVWISHVLELESAMRTPPVNGLVQVILHNPNTLL